MWNICTLCMSVCVCVFCCCCKKQFFELVFKIWTLLVRTINNFFSLKSRCLWNIFYGTSKHYTKTIYGLDLWRATFFYGPRPPKFIYFNPLLILRKYKHNVNNRVNKIVSFSLLDMYFIWLMQNIKFNYIIYK